MQTADREEQARRLKENGGNTSLQLLIIKLSKCILHAMCAKKVKYLKTIARQSNENLLLIQIHLDCSFVVVATCNGK